MKHYKLSSSELALIRVDDYLNCEFYEGYGVLKTELSYPLTEITELEYVELQSKYAHKKTIKIPSDSEKIWDALSFILNGQG